MKFKSLILTVSVALTATLGMAQANILNASSPEDF